MAERWEPGTGGGVPVVILVCRLSLSTSALFRSTATSATRMYVRLMSNTIEVPAGASQQQVLRGNPHPLYLPRQALLPHDASSG